MSIIAAGTTAGTALKSTGNTDGTIQLQVNGTTPSVTLATTGAIGVGSTPGYGTSGQVLTSAGSAAAPTWATAAAPSYALISTTTASSASSVTFTVSGYDTYLLQFYNVSNVGGSGTTWYLSARLNNATTSTNLYFGGGFIIGGLGTFARANNVSASYIPITLPQSAVLESATSAMLNGQMAFHNMNSTSVKYGSGFSSGFSNLTTQPTNAYGATSSFYTTSSYGAATSINLYMWDGTTTTTFSGTYVLYGLRTS